MIDFITSLIVTPLEPGFPFPPEEDFETDPRIPLIEIEDGDEADEEGALVA